MMTEGRKDKMKRKKNAKGCLEISSIGTEIKGKVNCSMKTKQQLKIKIVFTVLTSSLNVMRNRKCLSSM